MKEKNFKLRILIPLITAFFLLLGSFVFIFYWFHQEQLIEDVTNDFNYFQDLFTVQLENDAGMMASALEVILRDPKTKASLKKRDKESLLMQAWPLFNTLLSNHRVTHFYFTGPDRINILRIHKPEKYGDLIDRFTTLAAEKTGKISWGIELGPLGTLTLRVVAPLYEGNKLLGYVELGEEIEHISEKLHNILGLEIQVLIKKKYLLRHQWEAGMKMLHRKAPPWDQISSRVIIYQTMETFPWNIHQAYSAEASVETRKDLKFMHQGQYYIGRFIPLMDAGQRQIGQMLVISNITSLKKSIRSTLFLISGICVAAGSLLFIFFFLFLGRVQTQMETTDFELVRIRKAVENTRDSIIIMDHKGKISYWNPAAKTLFGYEAQEVLGKDLHGLIAPVRYHKSFLSRFDHFKKTGQGPALGNILELEALGKGGVEFPIELSISAIDLEGRNHAVGILRDITDRKQLEKKLLQLSYQDGLTGVANRRHFNETLEKEWHRMKRDGKPLSLIMCDIDFFKNYNDTYGHQKGDESLKRVASRLKELLKRPGDMVARYGGEEFAVILPDTDTQGALRLAEHMRVAVESLGIVHSGSQVSEWLTISMGVASMIPSGNTLQTDLISEADQALYGAKGTGRNRVHLLDKGEIDTGEKK